MKVGSLWKLMPEENWLWYNLFATNPVDNDVVVILKVQLSSIAVEGTLITFVSLVTGAEDFMLEEDFLKTFKPIGDINEESE